MEYLEAWGTLIHEKNLKSKISCQTPFNNAKSVILSVIAILRWLNNVVGVYLVEVYLLIIGRQGLGHFFRSRLLVPLG